jgi:hypothetical protein
MIVPKPQVPNEWDQLVVKIGTLALAVGHLEVAIIMMVCHILGKTEEQIGIQTNSSWCKKLNEVAPEFWSDEQRSDLARRLSHIRSLYRRRNKLIHSAIGIVNDDSVVGVPAGSAIDMRTYGIGFTKQEGNTFTFGVVAERVNLDEIDSLCNDVRQARVDLVPYMELVDQIKHPAKPFPLPVLGKRF